MKKTGKQIKMADLLLVHFTLIPGLVISQPDDFSGLDFNISQVIPGMVFLHFSEFLQQEQTTVWGSIKLFIRRGQSKKLQHFRSKM